MLARAFADDPIMNWSFPRAGDKGLRRMFGSLMQKIFFRDGVVYCSEDLAAGAMWAPPGTWPLDLRRQLRLVPSTLPLLGTNLPRAARWMQLVEAVHPREPHWYLAVLGTDPPSQGKGKGSAVMAPVLQRCDAEGLPSYLESSKEANVAFYVRHGFEVTRVIEELGAPPLFAMWRKPR